jgi:protein-glutamine gamma-glutamyltransferase
MSVHRAGSNPPETPDLSLAEAREAKSLLETEARDGKVTTGEIKAAERRMVAKYGAEKGRAMLIRALGQDPAKIDFDAVDYLQGRIGSMDGHIDRYQQVLLEHLAGAKLLDANFDGKLDKDDLVFTRDASGKVDVKRIGQALRDRVLIGGAMVDAAHAMAEAQHEFGDLKANPKFWRAEGKELGTMHLKPGVKPSDALRDIFAHPDKYQFECATALVTLRYKAILELIGERDFDRICKDLKIGPWVQEDDAAKAWKVRGKGQDGKTPAADDVVKKDLKPGDYTYFKNWSVSIAGYNGGWQGENVIYLGKGKYYGHPFGIVSAKEIVDSLNEWRRTKGNVKSASLLDLRASVDPSILKQDKLPG